MNREEIISKASNLKELAYRLTEWWDEDDQKDEGLSDIEYAIREAEYLIEDITEDTGHSLHDDWKEAKAIIRRTKDGKVKRISFPDMKVMDGWTDEEVRWAREFLDEVKRTKAFVKQLRKENEHA